MPLPAGARAGINDGAREFREREEREEAERRRKEEESRNKSMKREEWMLTLPEEVSLLSCQSHSIAPIPPKQRTPIVDVNRPIILLKLRADNAQFRSDGHDKA